MMQIPACVAAERVETQETEPGSLSPPEFGPEVVLPKDDPEELDVPPKELGTDNKWQTEKPYSIYTSTEKWFIVSMASLAALFSPLTTNIYLSAIPTLATVFNKPIELIYLTVTVYLVLQGVSPMIWGSLSDRLGRRPIFLVCLLILSMACVGLALVPTSGYWVFMLLRCTQAAGSASTIALGAGVIADIATGDERGSFYALFTLGPQLGPTIGPVIGGAIAQTLGWRWMFWLLCILSAGCFLVIMMCVPVVTCSFWVFNTINSFLPETLRLLVGDGSILPPKIHRPLILAVGVGRWNATAKLPASPPLSNPLRILTYLDVMNLLVFHGVQYSIFSAMTATISNLFQTTYPFLTEAGIGLCFLAVGGGTIVGGLCVGKLLDRDYRKMKEKIALEASTDLENSLPAEQVAKDENFPIEQARMRMVLFHLIVNTASCAGYGWCLEKKVHIAGPLVLQVVFGISSRAILNTVQTLLIDLLPAQGSSVTACNNLVKCSMSAATVSLIQLILNEMGTGWTYILLAGISLATAPMIWLAVWVGPRCRANRLAK